jgi:RNA polymerase sigma-70 factor, ECF subfamily
VQEVFLRYLAERTYGREITNPRAWLYQVLRNYLLDRRKAASTHTEMAGENVEGQPDPGHDPETLVTHAQIARKIAGALSGRELECLQLRAEGLSYEEIGVSMDVRTGTVGVLLSRALQKMRRLRSEGYRGLDLAAATHLSSGETACIRK